MPQKVLREVPIERVISKSQVRKTFDARVIAEIAQTIPHIGLRQPIDVRPEGENFVIIDGELRWRAAKIAGLATVPVLIESQELSEADVVLRQLISNCMRQDLSPLETANAIAGLIQKTGWNATQAAAQLGKSNAAITRALSLLTLPEPIRSKVESGAIPPSAAYELARIGDPARQADLAGQLAKGNLTRDGLTGALKAQRRHATSRDDVAVSRLTAVLGETRSVTVTGVGMTLETFIGSLEELLVKARKVRTQGVELATFLKMLKDQAKA